MKKYKNNYLLYWKQGKAGMPVTPDPSTRSKPTCYCQPGPAGKPVPALAGVESMKTQLYDGSRKIRADTRCDECLYRAARPMQYSPDIQRQGKDLYLHTDHDKKITFYFHLWEMSRTAKDKIIPVSPATAERFLRSKGLACNLFPKSDPIATLYNWGYGIAEEF